MDGTVEADASVTQDRFEQLHSRRDRLYRAVALAVGDAGLAAEAIDEAMARAYARWDRIEGYASPEGWVYRVAINVARSALRKTRREDLWELPPEEVVADDHPDLELRAAIGRLPVKFRSVVVARYLLDWSTADTAQALGIPEGTVKVRLKRALSRLAEDLPGEEG
ncbi:MAG TPA: sigma-70 family RNA polymerase sigma factor [Acidimicrobiia bacterium]|nr:sigma-70 family RNA polymerase sigma factor [Acidimicrobiia bacterium]